MNILEQIIAHKHKEVEEAKSFYPVPLLEKSTYFEAPVVSMKRYLQRENMSGIIAEIKRQSPSKGMINPHISVEQTSIGYMQAGASALSVLTDTKFFGGIKDDLIIARKFNYCPILRKDFIIDEYQLIESRSIGTDVILLIAAALAPEKLKQLATFAHQLGLEVLLEVRDQEELEASFNEHIDIVGVNNRNLKDFKVDVRQSEMLAAVIPDHVVKISESGIADPAVIKSLRQFGYKGFLMGEYFMKHKYPERACADFVRNIKRSVRGTAYSAGGHPELVSGSEAERC